MRYLRPCGPYNNAKKESMLRKEGEVEMAEVLLQKMARNSTMKRAKLGDCFIPKYAMMWKESVIQQKFTHIYPLKSDQWSLLVTNLEPDCSALRPYTNFVSINHNCINRIPILDYMASRYCMV
mmetsp:Transcript_25226/g.52741  ORF Transcript_25226/g.52741 Transcript_25226/m.52741 type:complete len:123 (-) Transcript_25226:1051-1419(-)